MSILVNIKILVSVEYERGSSTNVLTFLKELWLWNYPEKVITKSHVNNTIYDQSTRVRFVGFHSLALL